MSRETPWTCPDCGAPLVARAASHSCVKVDFADRFAGADPAVRSAFDRLVELATVDAADEMDGSFGSFVREAAARVGRRERLARSAG